MAEERPLLEEILDVAFFAPLGLAITIAEDFPALVRRGRRQLEGQFGMARFVGKIAAQQVKRRVDTFLDTPNPERRSETTVPDPFPEPLRIVVEATVSSDALAIDGYDSLAASQVVARLASLDAGELEKIRRYEEQSRRRQTILNRIAQLEANRDS